MNEAVKRKDVILVEILFMPNQVFKKCVSTMKNEHTDIQWIKLNKHFFRLQNDLFLATVYISPENSPENVLDYCTTSLDNVQYFRQMGDIFIQVISMHTLIFVLIIY